jgi:hypothetical protein
MRKVKLRASTSPLSSLSLSLSPGTSWSEFLVFLLLLFLDFVNWLRYYVEHVARNTYFPAPRTPRHRGTLVAPEAQNRWAARFLPAMAYEHQRVDPTKLRSFYFFKIKKKFTILYKLLFNWKYLTKHLRDNYTPVLIVGLNYKSLLIVSTWIHKSMWLT